MKKLFAALFFLCFFSYSWSQSDKEYENQLLYWENCEDGIIVAVDSRNLLESIVFLRWKETAKKIPFCEWCFKEKIKALYKKGELVSELYQFDESRYVVFGSFLDYIRECRSRNLDYLRLYIGLEVFRKLKN